MSQLSSVEASLVSGPPSLPDANAGETGQGETGAEETKSTGAEAVAAEAEPQPQPEDASAAAEESVAEGEAKTETAEAASETESEERAEYPEWLPWEPMKAYPDEILQLAAKELGISPETLGQKGVKELLTRNINALIENRTNALAQEEGAESAEETETAAAESKEGEEAGEQLKLTVPQLHETAMEIVEEMVTPEGSHLYTSSFKTAMDELYDATQSGDKEAIAKAEMGVAKTNLAFLLMALREPQIRTMLGNVVDGRLNQFTTNMQETRKTHGEAVTRLSKDPRFASVKQFVDSGKLKEVLVKYPELAQKQFVKAVNGKRVPLSPVENRMEQYKTAMALHRGTSNPPAPVLVRKGMEAGQKKAEELRNKSELGKLAAGRATGKLPGSQEESSQEYIERMKRAAEGEDPLSRAPREKRA